MDKSSPNPKDYRACVGIVLRNVDGLIFLAERHDAPGSWQMPQGGLDNGETIEQAALRELSEEIGTRNARIVGITADWHYYDFPPELRKQKWRGKWRGQRQRWVLADFIGQDSDIDLTADDHQEFSQWRWATAAEVLTGIIAFKQPVYEAVLTELLG